MTFTVNKIWEKNWHQKNLLKINTRGDFLSYNNFEYNQRQYKLSVEWFCDRCDRKQTTFSLHTKSLWRNLGPIFKTSSFQSHLCILQVNNRKNNTFHSINVCVKYSISHQKYKKKRNGLQASNISPKKTSWCIK